MEKSFTVHLSSDQTQVVFSTPSGNYIVGFVQGTVMDHNHNNLYPTREELEDILTNSGIMYQWVYDQNRNGLVDFSESVPWSGISGRPDTFPPAEHQHDSRYYTKESVDFLLQNKADINHDHNSLYFTKSEVSGYLSQKADINHNHDSVYVRNVDFNLSSLSDTEITNPQAGQVLQYSQNKWVNAEIPQPDLNNYMRKDVYDQNNDGVVDIAGQVDWGGIQNKPSEFPPAPHSHDDRYHTKLEVTTLLNQKSDIGHTHNPSDVGLGNVTNDAQLKRSGNDFNTFFEKTGPTDNDLVLIEDSETSYDKKKIKLNNIYLWIKNKLDNSSSVAPHTHTAADIVSGVLDTSLIPGLDASKIIAGSLSTDRFSAYEDLIAEGKILGSDLTIYLSPYGSDTNGNGTQSNPYFTINRALQDVVNVNLNGKTLTIQLLGGTYKWSGTQELKTIPGGVSLGQCRIVGDPGQPQNVTINYNGGGPFAVIAPFVHTPWELDGFTITGNVTQALIAAYYRSLLLFKNINFGSSTARHIISNLRSLVIASGNYLISGGATSHFGIYNMSFVEVYQKRVLLLNNPNFSTAFLHMMTGSGFNARFTVWQGSATGVRYNLNIMSYADTNGATLPGSIAGSVSNGSVYT